MKIRGNFLLLLLLLISKIIYTQNPDPVSFDGGAVKWSPQVVSTKVLIGDFNGDRMDDILYYEYQDQANWKLMTSKGDIPTIPNPRFEAPYFCAPGQGINNGVWVGDFNGDHVKDKVSQVFSADQQWGGWWVSLSKKIVGEQVYLYHFDGDVNWTKGQIGNQIGNINPNLNLIGDFNGDGTDDILYLDESVHNWKIMASDGRNFSFPRLATNTNNSHAWNGVWAGDFDGNGSKDYVIYDVTSTRNHGWYVSLANVPITPAKTSNISKPSAIPPIFVRGERPWFETNQDNITYDKVLIGDFNGDSKDDILFYVGNETWKILISTGSSFILSDYHITGENINSGSWAGDFNGDGYCDKITKVSNSTTEWNGFWVSLSHNPLSEKGKRKIGMWWAGGMTNYDSVANNYDCVFSTNLGGTWQYNDKGSGIDPQKIPVVGWGMDNWGVDQKLSYYCSGWHDVISKQINAMKKCYVDFISVDMTNGLRVEEDQPIPFLIRPSISGYGGDPISGNSMKNLFQTMADRTKVPVPIPITVALGVEVWGKSTFDFFSWPWTNWTDQDDRLRNAIGFLYSNFINNPSYSTFYFKYLGKPLVLTYLDKALDYPRIDGAGLDVPRPKFGDLTLMDAVTWRYTFGYKGNPGMEQKRYWGYGAGPSYDDPANRPLPKNSEIMSIMPGAKEWHSQSFGNTIVDRQKGEFYKNQWKQVLEVMPKIVLISSWNEWAEEYAIEGCRPTTSGGEGWKDQNNENTEDYYLQITEKYAYIFKNNELEPHNLVNPDTYFTQDDGTNNKYHYSGGRSVDLVTNVPPHTAVILLPSGWLTAHNYTINFPSNPKNAQMDIFPNPFNPTTNIEFWIAQKGNVLIKIYNILGQEIATLLNKEMPVGSNTVTIDGSKFPSGIYIVSLVNNNQIYNKKIILLK